MTVRRIRLALAAPRLRARRGRRAQAQVGWNELERELARARRYERSFVLLNLEAGGGGPERLARFERDLRTAVRRLDTVWGDRRNSYLLLPEGDEVMVDGLLARLSRDRPQLLRERRCTWAVFPRDGVTTASLVLESRGHHRDGPGSELNGGEAVDQPSRVA